MKRTELIELGVLAVVLILGFRAIETILNVIIYTLYSFSSTFRDAGGLILPNIIQIVLYVLGLVVLLKGRKWIANNIVGKNERNEDVALRIQKPELLYIIIVSLCLANLLSDISTILIYSFDYFKNQVAGYKNNPPITEGTVRLAAFKSSAVKLILTLVLLYFAKPVSNFLSKSSSSGLPLAETTDKQ